MKHQFLGGAAVGALAFAMAAGAHAQEAATAADAGVQEIVVLGGGEARQVQTVAGRELALAVPGASPLKLVDKLPSVNIQAADAFGAYEWAARITVRGFNQSQLGFTLDDVPLGDMTYGNHNGLHISRAIASENIGSVELAQGAGALETASANNLGGTLKYVSRAPSDQMHLLAAGSYGSADTWRGFVRFDTGEVKSGARAYISYSNNTSDKWKGFGQQKQQQVNFKAVQPIGAEGSLTGWLNWSKRRENDYQDMSLEMIDRLGYDWDNISDNWNYMVTLSEIANNRGDTGVTPAHPEFGKAYPAPIKSIDDAYTNAAGLRDDWVGALTYEQAVGEMLDVRITGYGHSDKGQGLWFTPYVPSPNYAAGGGRDDAPISIRTTEYDLQRFGVVAGATLHLGRHDLNGGVWYEDNAFNQARRYYALNRAAPQRDSLKMQSGPFRTDWEYDFTTTTWQFHLQDTWNVSDALRVNFGFKSLSVENTAVTVIGADKTGTIKAEENFLPQAGVRYDLNGSNQLFGSYARNMRAFPSSATSGPFSASQAGFLAIKDKLKPEISDTFELGWRFRQGPVQGLLAGYYVTFKDRLFAVPVGAGIIGNPSALSNVGGVTAKGIEAALNWRLTDDWTLFGSYAFTDSTYDDDTRDGNGVVVARTKGKDTVDTPDHLLKGELGYDDGALFGRVSVSYMSKRYFTYEDDQSVPGRAVADLSVGYRFHGSPWLEGLEIQANVSNLFDKRYISTINSNGFPLKGDSQTLLPAPPRQAFVTVRKTF